MAALSRLGQGKGLTFLWPFVLLLKKKIQIEAFGSFLQNWIKPTNISGLLSSECSLFVGLGIRRKRFEKELRPGILLEKRGGRGRYPDTKGALKSLSEADPNKL